jgi:electron transport complex protein RnfB
MGRGRGGGAGSGGGRGQGFGPQGECICPRCGTTKVHQAGVPCVQEQCPQCGASMVRKT